MINERKPAKYVRPQQPGSLDALAVRPAQLWRTALLHGGVLLLYALLAIVVLWPMPLAFTSGLIGADDGVDAFQCAWNIWWVAEALSNGRLPFFTWLLFFPSGVDLFWQTLQFSQGVVATPITRWLGPIAGVNWTVITSFIIGGYVTFLFARRLTGHLAGALLAGMVFAFSPYHLQKVVDGGLEVAAIQWIPCYFLALYLLLERPHWARALLCGALLLWASLGSWYYGLFCVLATGCVALVWLLVPEPEAARRGWSRPTRARWAAALWALTPVLLWGLVLAPRLLSLSGSPDELWDMRAIQVERSADLMDFFLPNPLHPLWGSELRAMREELYPGAIIWNVSLGWVGLAFGALGVVGAWRETRRWLALLGLTLLLALGPSLRIGGIETGLPLPFALIQDLPGIRSAQRPNHLVVISSLFLALIAAYGLAWLSARWPARGRAALAAGAVALLVAFDAYAGPMTVVSRPVHPFYATLPPPPLDATGRPLAALMPLPLYINVNRSENLTPQMTHAWPILGGYIARPPEYSFARYTPGVRELEGAAPIPDDIVRPGWPEAGQRGLAAYGIRYVTLDLNSDKDDYFAIVRDHAAQLGLGAPIVADAALEVYQRPESWPVGPLGFLGAGWQGLERQPPYRWRWMGEQAELRLFNPLDQPVRVTLSLNAASYAQPRELVLQLGATALGRLPIDASGPQIHRLSFLLVPGEHTLLLSAPASADPLRSGTPISVRLFELDLHFAELSATP
jgi:hypothetical protein